MSGSTAEAARQRGEEMADKILGLEVNRDVHHIGGKPVFHAWESLNEVFPEWTDDDTQKLYDEAVSRHPGDLHRSGLSRV